MKFKIKGESKKEHTIELWLERKEDGEVYLKGRDGQAIKILIKFKDGQFQRFGDAEMEGLKTDSGGRIEEIKVIAGVGGKLCNK